MGGFYCRVKGGQKEECYRSPVTTMYMMMTMTTCFSRCNSVLHRIMSQLE